MEYIPFILIGFGLGIAVYVVFKYFIDSNKERKITDKHEFYRFIVNRAYQQMLDKEYDDTVYEEIKKSYEENK